jgi:hypothetical protein
VAEHEAFQQEIAASSFDDIDVAAALPPICGPVQARKESESRKVLEILDDLAGKVGCHQ